MSTKDEQLLNEYKKELFGEYAETSTLTLEQLIESHRVIRRNNQEFNARWLGIVSDAKVVGKNLGYQEVTNGEYLSVVDLKSMTVLELANLLADLQE